MSALFCEFATKVGNKLRVVAAFLFDRPACLIGTAKLHVTWLFPTIYSFKALYPVRIIKINCSFYARCAGRIEVRFCYITTGPS
jgi:hypothetical protein